MDKPSRSEYGHFLCEQAVVTDVNRKTWTVTVETIHSNKPLVDVPCMVPYLHHANGEGIYYLPEVGARCFLATPNDGTPPFVMGYVGVPGAKGTEDSDPLRPTGAGGSLTDVSYQGRRPDLNPGDIALVGRDENGVILRRGGIVQIGATGIAQRIYIPVRNFIKDFAENYSMATFAGDVSWTVERPELDPTGKAPCTYAFHMNEFASDAKASLRIRHMPLSAPDSDAAKSVWEVHVAAQGIDRESGAVTDTTYSMVLQMDGTKTELIGANRTVTVQGDDALTVTGDRSITVGGTNSLSAATLQLAAEGEAALTGDAVRLGALTASQRAVLGDILVAWLAKQQWPVATVGGAQVAAPSPQALLELQKVLSSKVFVGP